MEYGIEEERQSSVSPVLQALNILTPEELQRAFNSAEEKYKMSWLEWQPWRNIQQERGIPKIIDNDNKYEVLLNFLKKPDQNPLTPKSYKVLVLGKLGLANRNTEGFGVKQCITALQNKLPKKIKALALEALEKGNVIGVKEALATLELLGDDEVKTLTNTPCCFLFNDRYNSNRAYMGTPIMLAIVQGNAAMVELLVNYPGVNKKISEDFGSPFSFMFSFYYQHYVKSLASNKIVGLIVSATANFDHAVTTGSGWNTLKDFCSSTLCGLEPSKCFSVTEREGGYNYLMGILKRVVIEKLLRGVQLDDEFIQKALSRIRNNWGDTPVKYLTERHQSFLSYTEADNLKRTFRECTTNEELLLSLYKKIKERTHPKSHRRLRDLPINFLTYKASLATVKNNPAPLSELVYQLFNGIKHVDASQISRHISSHFPSKEQPNLKLCCLET